MSPRIEWRGPIGRFSPRGWRDGGERERQPLWRGQLALRIRVRDTNRILRRLPRRRPAAVGLGMRVGVGEDVEVSGWYLGLGYAVLAGLAIAVGVLVRRRLANRGG